MLTIIFNSPFPWSFCTSFPKLHENTPDKVINKIIYDQKKNLYLATNQGLIYFGTKTKQLSISEINPQNPSALHSIYLNDILLDI